MSYTTRRNIALRIPADALSIIDREAKARHLSRTDYIIRAGTGTLDETVSDAIRRIETLEAEMQRIRELTGLG